MADACADAIAAGGLVHLFGTGHSRIPVEEMFPRYGSYPGFNPIVELSMTFHTQVVGANGQRQAMFIERMPGPRRGDPRQLRAAPDRRADRLLGERLSAVPIEMAIGRARPRSAGRRRHVGRAVAGAASPTHPAGRLLDHADVVLDLCTPAGDALVDDRRSRHAVAPGSTIAAVALVNEIKAQTAELLVERGAMPPVLTSAAVVGQGGSAELFDAAYAEHARRYARSLRGAG